MIAGVLVIGSGCSPGRIVGADAGSSEAEESGSSELADEGDFGSGEGEGEGDGDNDGDPWEDPCGDPIVGGARFLDICAPPDPCDQADCEACIGGLCVEPGTVESCSGLLLVEIDVGVEWMDTNHDTETVLADLDGVLGDELIVAGDSVIQAAYAGQLVVSEVLPALGRIAIDPLRIDADDHIDLVIWGQAQPSLVLGDGEGGFTAGPQPFPNSDEPTRGVPIDFDDDGDHDLLVSTWRAWSTQVYVNQGGVLSVAAEFDFYGGRGAVVDLDLDGFMDDALFSDYPSPTALIGDVGGLMLAPPLPEGPRGPAFEYGIGTPVAADLDGDGFIEVLAPLVDNHSRLGVRVWWGSAMGLGEPRDQLLSAPEDGYGVDQLELVELDGVAPPELLIRRGAYLLWARPDLVNQLPFGCVGPLFDGFANADVSVGDVEADGQPEIAVFDDHVQLFTVTTP